MVGALIRAGDGTTGILNRRPCTCDTDLPSIGAGVCDGARVGWGRWLNTDDRQVGDELRRESEAYRDGVARDVRCVRAVA